MKKRSRMLLVATILATAYTIYLINYFFGGTASAKGIDFLAGAIATALVMPHMLLFLIGTIFGWIGFILKKSWGALVAAILYSVGTLFFLAYAIFGVPILVFGFIGYAKQKKINKKNTENEI